MTWAAAIRRDAKCMIRSISTLAASALSSADFFSFCAMRSARLASSYCDFTVCSCFSSCRRSLRTSLRSLLSSPASWFFSSSVSPSFCRKLAIANCSCAFSALCRTTVLLLLACNASKSSASSWFFCSASMRLVLTRCNSMRSRFTVGSLSFDSELPAASDSPLLGSQLLDTHDFTSLLREAFSDFKRSRRPSKSVFSSHSPCAVCNSSSRVTLRELSSATCPRRSVIFASKSLTSCVRCFCCCLSSFSTVWDHSSHRRDLIFTSLSLFFRCASRSLQAVLPVSSFWVMMSPISADT
mmetsp:Transcript_21087/g.49322  ORF Transcript_21087/g.49322 Transcript_21087/m.49322 type:complete len:297 (+) Transcript_21087:1327-2217(+)